MAKKKLALWLSFGLIIILGYNNCGGSGGGTSAQGQLTSQNSSVENVVVIDSQSNTDSLCVRSGGVQLSPGKCFFQHPMAITQADQEDRIWADDMGQSASANATAFCAELDENETVSMVNFSVDGDGEDEVGYLSFVAGEWVNVDSGSTDRDYILLDSVTCQI